MKKILILMIALILLVPSLAYADCSSLNDADLFMTMDDDCTTDDSSNSETFVNNGAVNVAGKLGNGCDFEAGESDWINVTAGILNSNYGSGTTTVAGLFKMEDSAGQNLAMFGAGDANAANPNTFLAFRNANGDKLAAFAELGDNQAFSSGTYSGDTSWNSIRAEFDTNGKIQGLWVNGLYQSQDTTFTIDLTPIDQASLGSSIENSGKGQYFDGILDNWGVWGRAWTDAEAEAWNNSGDYCDPFASAASATTNISASDEYDGSRLENFTVTIFNSSNTYTNSTSSGELIFGELGGLMDLNFSSNQSGGYFNKSYTSINVSNDFIGELYQAIIYMNASKVITGDGITSFDISAPNRTNSSNSTGWARLILKAGDYNISASSSGYVEWLVSVSVTNLDKKLTNISLGTGNLTIKAKAATSGELIENFTIVLWNEDLFYNYTVNKSTKGAAFGEENDSVVFRVIAGNYNMSIDATNYAVADADITIAVGNMFPNYTFNIYGTNSINFTIYDEFDKRLMDNETVFINIISGVFADNYSTSNGTLYVEVLEPSDYRFSYYSDKYTIRDYYQTIVNRTFNEIDLYLLSTGNSTDVDITVTDENARQLANGTIKMLRHFVDTNSYTTVAMARTDSTGKAQLNLDLYDGFYYFVIERKGKTLLTTSPSRVIDTALSYSVFIGKNILESREELHRISHSMSFNNDTEQVRFVYNDAGSSLQEACLVVERLTADGRTEVCNTCSTDSSGTLLCTINSSQGSHRAYSRVKTTSNNVPYVLEMRDIISRAASEAAARFGAMGVYLTAYLIMGLALLGTPFPYLSISLAVIGFVFATVMGILGLGYTSLTSIIILGALIMYKVRR